LKRTVWLVLSRPLKVKRPWLSVVRSVFFGEPKTVVNGEGPTLLEMATCAGAGMSASVTCPVSV
jgi:hypothetical protein